MNVDRRRKNVDWRVANIEGNTRSWDEVQIAVAMDIRDELQRLNRLLHCPNFIAMPRILREIRRNTTKPKRKKAVKK